MFVYGFPEHGKEILKREYKRYSRVTRKEKKRKEKSRKLNEKNGKETQITRRWNTSHERARYDNKNHFSKRKKYEIIK